MLGFYVCLFYNWFKWHFTSNYLGEQLLNQRAMILAVQIEFEEEVRRRITPPLSQSAAFSHVKAKNSPAKKRIFPLIFARRIPA